jgi:hypothetical protein
MINNKKFGKHENVLFADFGNGDIKITRAREEDSKHETILLFYNQPPRPIGEENDEWNGKSSDELEAPGFAMTFSNPQSITSLIHSLIELQKSVFASTNMPKPIPNPEERDATEVDSNSTAGSQTELPDKRQSPDK